MHKQEKGLSRRQMLGMAIGLSGFAISGKTGSSLRSGGEAFVYAASYLRPVLPPNKTARPASREVLAIATLNKRMQLTPR